MVMGVALGTAFVKRWITNRAISDAFDPQILNRRMPKRNEPRAVTWVRSFDVERPLGVV